MDPVKRMWPTQSMERSLVEIEPDVADLSREKSEMAMRE
jgi:hypothetical protein